MEVFICFREACQTSVFMLKVVFHVFLNNTLLFFSKFFEMILYCLKKHKNNIKTSLVDQLNWLSFLVS